MKNAMNRYEPCTLEPRNERGIALVLALVMLLILGMLGTLSLNTSSTELRVAGNYRTEQLAFYNADQVELYGPNNEAVKDKLGLKTNETFSSTVSHTLGETYVQVVYKCASKPVGHSDEASFLSYHFLVTIVGKGSSNAEYVIESEVLQTGPKAEGLEPDC